MTYAVYDTATGLLISTGDVVASPLPSGMSATTVTSIDGVWNAATHVFDPAPVVHPPIPKSTIIKRLTVAEFTAFKNSTDANIEYFWEMFRAADMVDPNDTATQNGFAYATSIGILASGRTAQILA